jgi:hypothetical protein
MDLFGRNAAETDSRANAAAAASHRLTLDLSRAETLATMLAHSRASRVVDVADLVAGMYLYGWERLSRYWEVDNQEQIESVLRKMCQISPQRWNYWIQFYDTNRRTNEKAASLPRILQKFQKTPASKPPLKRSAELAAIFRQAEEIAPLRDTSGDRSIPILTSECVLLCVIRNRGTEIGRKLVASGMNVPQLEKDALSSRRAPRA